MFLEHASLNLANALVLSMIKLRRLQFFIPTPNNWIYLPCSIFFFSLLREKREQDWILIYAPPLIQIAETFEPMLPNP